MPGRPSLPFAAGEPFATSAAVTELVLDESPAPTGIWGNDRLMVFRYSNPHDAWAALYFLDDAAKRQGTFARRGNIVFFGDASAVNRAIERLP